MLGYVPQKGVLFTGDILSNLEFAGDVSEADAIRAAATAQAEDFIWSRPQHFLTPVAQGGANVSGGQRQRLSIARAIAKHPQVYLFDDSFSALDYQTDAALRQALARQTHDATVLIVAQRLSTILHADQIPRARRRAHRRLRHTRRAAAQLRNLPRDRAQPAQRRGTRTGGLTMAGHRHGPGRIPEKPKNFKGTLRKLLRCLGAYRFALALVLVLALASTALRHRRAEDPLDGDDGAGHRSRAQALGTRRHRLWQDRKDPADGARALHCQRRVQLLPVMDPRGRHAEACLPSARGDQREDPPDAHALL